MDAGKVSSQWNENVITEKMNNQETFIFDYIDADGIKKLLYFRPIDKTRWYFISMVERKVFTEQTYSFVLISLSMLVIAVGIVATMLLLVTRANNNVIKAMAESKARSEFLSNMSHEIRTPLNGIIGLLYLLRSHAHDNDTKKMEELLDKADNSAEYLLALVSDILDMSKLQAEKLKLKNEPFDIKKMLEAVADMQRSNIEHHNISFKLDFKISSPYIISDETRLKQILMNIIGNSVKFTPSGGTISMSAEQGEVVNGNVSTKIVCSDTGIGMSEEFQKNIWESFTQEHNKLSNGLRGTGLGMAITKGIIDAMGGTISVQSKLNVGSTFTIELQLPVTDSLIIEEVQNPESKKFKKVENIKLLIAEDNELNAEILSEILKEKGFEVSIAENGKIAFEIFENSKPDEYYAILMDMQMPVMDGCEASSLIRKSSHPDAKKIKIFACTANVFQEDKDRALESGMNDFLIKPIDVDVLFEKLKIENDK